MKVDNEVLAVLDRAHIDGNSLFLIRQLDRRLYVTIPAEVLA